MILPPVGVVTRWSQLDELVSVRSGLGLVSTTVEVPRAISSSDDRQRSSGHSTELGSQHRVARRILNVVRKHWSLKLTCAFHVVCQGS